MYLPCMKLYKLALIIDDDPDLCMLLKAMLTSYIPEVNYVYSIKHSKELLKTIQPDVVFIDNNLPDGRGVLFVQELKTTLPGARIIVISAMAGLKQLAMEHGADVFIEKPLTLANVQNALEAL
jgi:DNA-binding response OmpR family regulator